MKYRSSLLEQLKKQAFFDKNVVRQLSEPYGVASATVDAFISRSLLRKDILPLRKGLYIAADFYDRHRTDISYTFYLANVLRKPSYISSWTALQYYNLTTEVIRTVTSVTPKLTRAYRTRLGTFEYGTIKPGLFTGFRLERGQFDFFIASPAKALFDLLYSRTRQLRGVQLHQVEPMVEDLRVDLGEMDDQERQTFHTLIATHLSHE
jgi:predicted transcriptional regulator of viral defense system